MLTAHHVATALVASRHSHPDLDLVVADNLPDRPYYLSGATIYLSGALTTAAAWDALMAALDELASVTPTTRPLAPVIPMQRRIPRVG